MSLISEFSEFLKKYEVLGLAVAFIIGTAATKLVTAITTDLILPVVNLLLPGGNWQTATISVGPAKILIGDFIGVLIDFVIIAIVVFLIVKMVMKEEASKKR